MNDRIGLNEQSVPLVSHLILLMGQRIHHSSVGYFVVWMAPHLETPPRTVELVNARLVQGSLYVSAILQPGDCPIPIEDDVIPDVKFH